MSFNIFKYKVLQIFYVFNYFKLKEYFFLITAF